MQKSDRTVSDLEAHNKAVVFEYYERLCQQWNFKAARKHIGNHFAQYSPAMADGIDAVRDRVPNCPPFTDQLQADVRRVPVDGDFVVLHTLASVPSLPDMPEMAIADLFRLEHGKVAQTLGRDPARARPGTARHGTGIV